MDNALLFHHRRRYWLTRHGRESYHFTSFHQCHLTSSAKEISWAQSREFQVQLHLTRKWVWILIGFYDISVTGSLVLLLTVLTCFWITAAVTFPDIKQTQRLASKWCRWFCMLPPDALRRWGNSKIRKMCDHTSLNSHSHQTRHGR